MKTKLIINANDPIAPFVRIYDENGKIISGIMKLNVLSGECNFSYFKDFLTDNCTFLIKDVIIKMKNIRVVIDYGEYYDFKSINKTQLIGDGV